MIIVALLGLLNAAPPQPTPVYGYRVVHAYPHDPAAFTQGLEFRGGFLYEGTFRQHMIAKARNRDDAWFSMLDSEWPVRKRNFERWLEPGNFDERGAQKISLAALNAAPE